VPRKSLKAWPEEVTQLAPTKKVGYRRWRQHDEDAIRWAVEEPYWARLAAGVTNFPG
jgi:hypothetical protein